MERPVTYEEAVVLAREIAEALGGRQQEAILMLVRYAERGRKPSLLAAQHFRAASEALPQKKGP